MHVIYIMNRRILSRNYLSKYTVSAYIDSMNKIELCAFIYCIFFTYVQSFVYYSQLYFIYCSLMVQSHKSPIPAIKILFCKIVRL